MFIKFIKSLFSKQKHNDDEIQVVSIKEPLSDVFKQEIPESPCKDEDIIPENIKGAFYHSQERLKERFGYHLSYENYQKWCDLILTNSPKARFVRHSGGNPNGTHSKIYLLEMFQKKIPVVWLVESSLIVTILPYNLEMEREATAKKPKPKGRASKQVGHGDLNKYKKSWN